MPPRVVARAHARARRKRERAGRGQVGSAVTSEGLVSDVIVPLRKVRLELGMFVMIWGRACR